jgi:hypothetical protein
VVADRKPDRVSSSAAERRTAIVIWVRLKVKAGGMLSRRKKLV